MSFRQTRGCYKTRVTTLVKCSPFKILSLLRLSRSRLRENAARMYQFQRTIKHTVYYSHLFKWLNFNRRRFKRKLYSRFYSPRWGDNHKYRALISRLRIYTPNWSKHIAFIESKITSSQKSRPRDDNPNKQRNIRSRGRKRKLFSANSSSYRAPPAI